MFVFILSFISLISLNILSPILHLPLKDGKMYTLVLPYVLSVLFYVSKSNVKDICTPKMVIQIFWKSCLRSVHVPYLTRSVFELICSIRFLCGLQLWHWFSVLEVPLQFLFLFFFILQWQTKLLKSFIRPVFTNHLNKRILKHSLCSSLNFFWMISGTADWYIIFDAVISTQTRTFNIWNDHYCRRNHFFKISKYVL